MTSVQLTIKNIWDLKKEYSGAFLVDSGAQFTVLPDVIWKKLGIKSRSSQQFSLADGTIITRPIGDALIQFKNTQAPSPVVLGEKGDSPLLGVFTLEALGLVLDPLKRELYKARMML